MTVKDTFPHLCNNINKAQSNTCVNVNNAAEMENTYVTKSF